MCKSGHFHIDVHSKVNMCSSALLGVNVERQRTFVQLMDLPCLRLPTLMAPKSGYPQVLRHQLPK
jgi:hypothetical protein